MKKDVMGAQFVKLRDFAEALGFTVDAWRIKENASGDGCVGKMRISAKDDKTEEAIR